VFDPNITWTAPGNNSLAGVYHGHEAVVGFFTKLHEITGGTFALQLERIIADDNGVVAIVQASGQRDEHSYSWGYAHVWEMKDHKAISFTEYTNDSNAQDALFA
jgi:ketosteroid isomerase-like protein